jgi:hypothetical protein
LSEAYDDYQDRLEAARLRALIAETGVRVCELAVLLSAFEDVARGAQLLYRGDVPGEELPGPPDPHEPLAKEEDMTTGESLEFLQRFLGMSEEGKERLRSLLSLEFGGSD